MYQLLNDTSGASYYFITGGLGSGKTTGGTIAMLVKILTQPTVKNWWEIAPTYLQAEDTLVPCYFDILENYFGMLEGRDYRYIKSKPNQIHLKRTKQKIFFHSGDRPQNMVSISIGGFRVTEAGIQKRGVFEGCTARARDKKTKSIFGLFEGTPEGDGWFREEGDFNKLDKNKKYRRFILHTEDNAHNLSPDYIERLANVYRNQHEKLKSYLFGEFTSFNRGSAYWDFYESTCVVHNTKLDPTRPVRMTWDFQRAPLAFVVQQQQPTYRGTDLSKTEQLKAVFESSGKSRGLVEAVAEFIAEINPDKNTAFKRTPILLDGGHDGHFGGYRNEQSAFKELRHLLLKKFEDVRIVAQKQAPRVQARLQRINILFLYQLYVIDSRCAKLINAYNTTSTKPGTWELVKAANVLDDTTHYSDASDYGAFNGLKDIELDGTQLTQVSGVSRI